MYNSQMYYIARFFNGELYYLEKIKVYNPLHIKKKFVWQSNIKSSENYSYTKREKAESMINVLRKHRPDVEFHIAKD